MKITQLVCSAWTFCILSLPVTAQEALWLHLSPPQSIPTDLGSSDGFYISRVMDARPTYMQTGFVYRENKHVRVQLFFSEGLEEHIRVFLAHSLPVLPHDQPVAVRINRLFVGEYTTEKHELGTAAIELDFLADTPKGMSLLAHTYALVKNEGDKAIEMHEANLKKALEECMTQFRQAYKSQTSLLPTFEWPAPDVSEEPALPPVQVQNPQRGIYRSFVEWQMNQPSITLPFVMKKKAHSGKRRYTHKTTIHYTDPEQGKGAIENVWGFSDGEQMYIYFQREYWPLRPVRGGFLFNAYAAIEDNKMVASMMENGVTAPFTGIVYINRKQTYFLDAQTGQIVEAHPSMNVPPEGPATAAPLANLTIYYKASRKTVPSGGVQVIFSGKQDTLVADLRPNSFISVPWTHPDEAVVVCIKGNPASCFTFVPSFIHANYLEYIPSPDKEDVVIHPVQSRDAVLTLRQMGQEDAVGNKAEPKQKP